MLSVVRKHTTCRVGLSWVCFAKRNVEKGDEKGKHRARETETEDFRAAY